MAWAWGKSEVGTGSERERHHGAPASPGSAGVAVGEAEIVAAEPPRRSIAQPRVVEQRGAVPEKSIEAIDLSVATAPSPAMAVASQPIPTLSPEAAERAAMMRRMAAGFGDIVGLLMQTPQFKHLTLTDLEWLVLPALRTGQCLVMEHTDRTTGANGALAATLWARVSEDVEHKIVECSKAGHRLRLQPSEWVSGDRHWLVTAIGSEPALKALLQQMRNGLFRDVPLALGVQPSEAGMIKLTLDQIVTIQGFSTNIDSDIQEALSGRS